MSGDEDETSAGDNVNPLIATADNDSRYERKNWNGNAAFQWEIVDNLKLRVEAGLDTYDQTKDRFYGMTTYLIYNSNRPGPATQYTRLYAQQDPQHQYAELRFQERDRQQGPLAQPAAGSGVHRDAFEHADGLGL